MFSPRAMIQAAVGYVRKNPDEVVRVAVNATGLRFGKDGLERPWA